MGATLDALLALQEIELQIVDIRRQLTARQRSVARQATRLKEAEHAVEAGRTELRRAQVAMDEIDVDLKGRNAHIGRLRDNLNTVRTNKEYAAVLSQLNNEKADASRLENRELELMTEVEAKRKAVGDLEVAVREESQRLENLRGQFAQAQVSFTSRLAALEQQRQAAADALDARAYELFSRISERYDGEAMARLRKVHPRREEYVCDGCNMGLSAEKANALATRDEVVTCGSCGRILYPDRSQ